MLAEEYVKWQQGALIFQSQSVGGSVEMGGVQLLVNCTKLF